MSYGTGSCGAIRSSKTCSVISRLPKASGMLSARRSTKWSENALQPAVQLSRRLLLTWLRNGMNWSGRRLTVKFVGASMYNRAVLARGSLVD
jgi:hypothetical protein